jgi:hypothetical protein
LSVVLMTKPPWLRVLQTVERQFILSTGFGLHLSAATAPSCPLCRRVKAPSQTPVQWSTTERARQIHHKGNERYCKSIGLLLGRQSLSRRRRQSTADLQQREGSSVVSHLATDHCPTSGV